MKESLCLALSLFLVVLPIGPVRAAQPDHTAAEVPQDVPLPPAGEPTMPSGKDAESKFFGPPSLFIRGPEEALPIEQQYLLLPPEFYERSRLAPLPVSLKSFIEDVIVPKESFYFESGIGMDPKTSMPYDHIRIRLKENLMSEIGNYTAASKLSLSIPYLLKVIQRKPEFRKAKLSPQKAEAMLRQTLETLLDYIRKYPDYGGFLPWVDIRPNGTIAPANTKIPSLDNGQLTWALAAVVAAFEDSPYENQKELAKMAEGILEMQDYKKFYNDKIGILYGTIQMDPQTKQWSGDKTYFLNDMFEGTLAVLWGVLHGQIPEEAWYHLAIPTTEYMTESNEKITTLAGFRASFHENWALAFLPFMESALAPLYQNYLYAQADYAHKYHLPGFLSTAYDPKGVYRQMGIPEISQNPVDRADVSVVFATAMAMLISPIVGASWLAKLYGFDRLVLPYGAVESVGKDGYADIFTADAKGMTLLAVSGGVLDEVKKYLQERTVPRTGISMYVKLLELMHAKYKQMLQERENEPLYFPKKPFPPPPDRPIAVHYQKPPDAGEVFDISAHLQSGHLHGKNVRSVGQKTLEQDIHPGGPIQFEYEIPPFFPYFDQWAFRGTYIDKAVRIADMRYLSFVIPSDTPPQSFEIELKSDDITLATVMVDTTRKGKFSDDGKWKMIAERIEPIPESDDKPFNYVSIAMHDPRYLLGAFSKQGRSGTVHLENITLTQQYPFPDLPEPPQNEGLIGQKELELIRYWRLSHGNLVFKKNDFRETLQFVGGSGWRGGYIPYTNLSKFNFLYLRVRNLADDCNCFYIELKHEADQLLGEKIAIHLPRDKFWHVLEIKIPQHIKYTFNYIAVSDPYHDFELGSLLLAQSEILDAKFNFVKYPQSGRKPRECLYQPCVD